MKSSARRAAIAALASIASLAAAPFVTAPAQAVGDPTILSIEYSGRTPANANGWNDGTVTVGWRCTWQDGTAYDITREVSDEGQGQTVTGTCEQPDGSRVQDTQGDINIDYTSPDVEFLSRTSANAAGWNKGPVKVQWTCTDTLSGTVSETVSKTLVKEGHAQTAQGTCRDLAGNETTGAEVDRINIDLTAPYAADELVERTPANDAGWNNAPVTVTWSCLDEMSGPAADESTVVFDTEGEGGTATGRCADKAGNVVRPTETVNLDETAPTITVADRTPANAAGWNNTPVDITWSCDDAISGVDNAGDQASLTTEGVDQSATGTCTDVAGNSATDTVSGVQIDLTAPILEWTGGPADGSSYFFGMYPAPTCFAGDLLSGSGECTVADDSTVVGPHTLTATARDVAGNETTGTRTFTVKSWRTQGFIDQPRLKQIKPQATRRLTFEAFAGSKEITKPSLLGATYDQVRISCTTLAQLAPARDDLGQKTTFTSAGVFSTTWKAPAVKGCYSVRGKLADGSKLFASFRVK